MADSPTATVQQGLCDSYMCGTNSPQIAEFGFWELNLPASLGIAGQPNNVGVQLVGFYQGGTLYQPKVLGGKLTASHRYTYIPPFNTVTLSSSQLVGGYFLLQVGARQFQLQVTEVGRVQGWAQPASGAPFMLESYKLDWTEVKFGKPGELKNMCNNPPSSKDTDSGMPGGMIGDLAFQTLLFEGDRIDAAKKTDYGLDQSWFNLGCAGSALAKLALTGHTQGAVNAGAFSTSLPQRQTILKMFAADYCGDGTPFTVSGQPLQWLDDAGTMKMAGLSSSPPAPLALESRWTDSGAACINYPRLDVNPTAAATAQFGKDIYDQVLAHCPDHMPPSCGSDADFNPHGFHMVSATPKPST